VHAEMLKATHSFYHETCLAGGFDETEGRNFTLKTSSNKCKENHCIKQSRNQYIV